MYLRLELRYNCVCKVCIYVCVFMQVERLIDDGASPEIVVNGEPKSFSSFAMKPISSKVSTPEYFVLLCLMQPFWHYPCQKMLQVTSIRKNCIFILIGIMQCSST